MNDVIQVTLKENEDMTANPKQYNYVVDVGREAIMDDLKSDQSLLRSWFHDTPNLEKFMDEKLEEVQQMIGQKVASTHARRSKPPPLQSRRRSRETRFLRPCRSTRTR